jgi:helix-turn-helix protein
MTNIRTPSAAANGDATPFRKKSLLQAKLHGDRRLTDAERCVGFFIIDWYGIEGRDYTFTRHDRLAEYTGLDVRTVRRSIARLVALGYIIIKMRGRWGRASEYVPVFLPVYEDIAMSSCSPHMRTGSSAHEDIAMSAHEDKAMSTHTLPTRSANEGLVVSPADAGALAPDGARTPRGVGAASDGAAPFEAFWAVYPRKEGRVAAKKAFDAAIARRVPAETIIDGARRYAAAKVNIDTRWIKMPANWLRDECWLEDPQPPGRKEPKPERAPKASKANGKAPVEPVEPDDDVEEKYYPGPEQLYPRGSCVWYRPDGRKGEVISARDDGGLHYVVEARWEPSGGIGSVTEDQLVTEDPLTPEERAAAEVEWARLAAEAKEREAKREAEREAERVAWLAEYERKRRAEAETERNLRRFPIGSRVDSLYIGDCINGRVLEVLSDLVLVYWGRWEGDKVHTPVEELVPIGAAPSEGLES